MPEMLADRFAILEGEPPRKGGLSVVRKAVDTRTGESVAVKFVNAATDALTKKIFQREVATLSTLTHENIVRLIDSGIDDSGTYFLVLDWYESSLADLLEERGTLTWQEALDQLGTPLAAGLSYAHLKGVEHRDIKPANILISSSGAPVLCDFGIGKLNRADATDLTVQSFRSGIYAPPELEAPAKYIRDVYSIGVVLLQAMHSERLTDYPQIEAALAAVFVPPDFRKLLERCLSSDPTARPENGSVLREELRRLVDGGHRRATADSHVAFLRITKRTRQQLVGEGGDLDSADTILLKDVLHEPQVEFRFDHERAVHDSSTIFLTGESRRYTLKPETATGELFVTGATRLEYEALEQARRRGLSVSGWLTWTTTRPRSPETAQKGLDLLTRSLEDFYAVKDAGGLVDGDDGDDGDVLLDGWLRLLQAREDLARGDRQPLRYEGRVARKREVTLTLAEPCDADLLGSEWEVRTGGDSRRGIARGEIVMQKGQDVSLLLSGRVPALPFQGLLVPHLGPSQVALQRQYDAVTAVKGETSARPDLKGLLTTPKTAREPREVLVENWRGNLDADKKRAVTAALGAEDLLVVKGPPGTGKTSFITELVVQFLETNPSARVLIVSQTHVAVDNALERIDATGLSGLVRLGTPDDPRVAKSVSHLLLDQQMSKWASVVRRQAEQHLEEQAKEAGVPSQHLRACLALQQLIAVLREEQRVQAYIQAAERGPETSTLATSLELEANAIDLQQRVDDLADQQKELRSRADHELAGDLTLRTGMSIEEAQAAVDALLDGDEANLRLLKLLKLQGEWLQRVASDTNLAAAFLETTHVIAGTCLGFLRHRAVRSLEIDLCIVDEASKATATEALVPMARAKRSILVGDINQLPPLDEDLLRRKDLLEEHSLDREMIQETLFRRLVDQLPANCQHALLDQYRMIRPIGDLISTCFYDGQLRSPRTEGLVGYPLLSKPVLWLDTSRLGGKRHEDSEAGSGSSYANRTEARVVIDRLRALDGAVSKEVLQLPEGAEKLDVLLIAPYRSQVEELRRRLASFRSESLRVIVESVDAVQGRETDLAIFSVTRSNSSGRLGFLGPDYWRRINVALSRARYGLTIVGDAEFCSAAPGALKKVLAYILEHPEDCELRMADRA